jgi:diguanylate cyclase
MLWKRKKSLGAEPIQVIPEAVSAGGSADKALDVVATMLRLYGKYAFDTDTAEARHTAAQCDEWATRISIGPARPLASAMPGTPTASEERVGPLLRDWPGLIGFLHERRRAESEYVVRSMSGFREAILVFADCLGKSLGEDRQSDARVGQRLDKLSRAIETRDATRICAHAQEVVDTVRHAMAHRRRREMDQISALGERLRELREELSEARKRAEVDALTQLSNRAAFDEQLNHLASLGVLLGEAPWLFLVDLDHFKAINDNYGHPAGDEVLRQVSRSLSRTFLRKQDFVCRYGGEEFAALLLDTTESQAGLLAERLIGNVRDLTVKHGPHEICVTLSIGLAALGPGESAQSWIHRADSALYRAKSRGRDRHDIAPLDPPSETPSDRHSLR